MTISSSAFDNNDSIPVEYTCEGEGISPPLTISEVPQESQSLALTVDDPDAPGGVFTHWMIWNISPATEDIEEGEIPPGVKQGLNSAGGIGYIPPCPPIGTHHYVFNLYALDSKLNLSSHADKAELEEAMEDHIVSQTQLTGLYGRDEEVGSYKEEGLEEY